MCELILVVTCKGSNLSSNDAQVASTHESMKLAPCLKKRKKEHPQSSKRFPGFSSLVKSYCGVFVSFLAKVSAVSFVAKLATQFALDSSHQNVRWVSLRW